MPHACVRCKEVYPERSDAILKGCTCGSRIFYFIKSELPAMEVAQMAKTISEGQQKATDAIVEEISQMATEKTIIIENALDTDAVENIRVLEQGAYSLNVAALMKGDPVIVKSDADVYYVRLPTPNEHNGKHKI